jgi:hypothetical protein
LEGAPPPSTAEMAPLLPLVVTAQPTPAPLASSAAEFKVRAQHGRSRKRDDD